MKNKTDLFEVFARRRQLCRLSVKKLDDVVLIIQAIKQFDNSLHCQEIAGFHPNHTSQFYIYISYRFNTLIEGISYDKNADHEKLGHLFGYPECCIRSFCEHLSETSLKEDYELGLGYWEPALNKSIEQKQNSIYKISYSIYMNPTLNTLAHFPCSLDCSQSIEIAKWRYYFKHGQNINDTTYEYNDNKLEFCVI